jgi:hypothetical protein
MLDVNSFKIGKKDNTCNPAKYPQQSTLEIFPQSKLNLGNFTS